MGMWRNAPSDGKAFYWPHDLGDTGGFLTFNVSDAGRWNEAVKNWRWEKIVGAISNCFVKVLLCQVLLWPLWLDPFYIYINVCSGTMISTCLHILAAIWCYLFEAVEEEVRVVVAAVLLMLDEVDTGHKLLVRSRSWINIAHLGSSIKDVRTKWPFFLPPSPVRICPLLTYPSPFADVRNF